MPKCPRSRSHARVLPHFWNLCVILTKHRTATQVFNLTLILFQLICSWKHISHVLQLVAWPEFPMKCRLEHTLYKIQPWLSLSIWLITWTMGTQTHNSIDVHNSFYLSTNFPTQINWLVKRSFILRIMTVSIRLFILLNTTGFLCK